MAVTFKVEHGTVEAVKGVSFQLHRGETVAIVGESGSGKSVTARTIMGLLTKRATVCRSARRIEYNGRDVLKFSTRERRSLRGDRISMIFQEPMSSLNPIYTIGSADRRGDPRASEDKPARGARRVRSNCSTRCIFPTRNRGSANIRISFPAASASA